MITPLQRKLPIVDKEGKQSARFEDWQLQVSRLEVLVGTGSPEGVIEALQTRFYMDLSGTAGSILYVKRDFSDVGGDTTKGWILV